MRRSSPTHATGERVHPHLLFLELPSQVYPIINAFPVCSCSQLWDFHSFPQLLLPFAFLPTTFPLIAFSSPASLFLRYAQLDKKTLLLRPGFSRWRWRISTVAAFLRTHSTLGPSLLISVFLLCEISPKCEIWKCCATLSKDFFGNFQKIRQKSMGKRLSSPGLTISSYRW